jgi:hypothetical protein
MTTYATEGFDKDGRPMRYGRGGWRVVTDDDGTGKIEEKAPTMLTHTLTITPLPYADVPNDARRVACADSGCEQLATIEWHFAHTNGDSSDNPLCPRHAAEWMTDYATPDNDYWLGR